MCGQVDQSVRTDNWAGRNLVCTYYIKARPMYLGSILLDTGWLLYRKHINTYWIHAESAESGRSKLAKESNTMNLNHETFRIILTFFSRSFSLEVKSLTGVLQTYKTAHGMIDTNKKS